MSTSNLENNGMDFSSGGICMVIPTLESSLLALTSNISKHLSSSTNERRAAHTPMNTIAVKAGHAFSKLQKRSYPRQDVLEPLRKKRKQRRTEFSSVEIPVGARVVHSVPCKNRRYVDHTYLDYSRVAPPSDSSGEPQDIKQMSFVQKVHHMLSQTESKEVIWWLPHGRAFQWCNLVDLEHSQILGKYFGFNRAAIFILLLRSYGFKQLLSGKDQGSFYHECMLRGLPFLTRYIPAPRDVRFLVPDPDNEPCLDSISKRYPLPLAYKGRFSAHELSSGLCT